MTLRFLDRRFSEKEMSFVDHLEDLRWHIVRSVLVVVVSAIVAYIKIDWIFEWVITGPLKNNFITYRAFCKLGHIMGVGESLCMQSMEKVELQTTTFSSQFISSITIAFLCGFIFAFPYVLWEAWAFIKPALTKKERANSSGAIFWITFYFLLGIGFGYFLLSPLSFSFLFHFKLGLSNMVRTQPTLDDYLDSFVDILFTCGLTFQLPVFTYALTKIGIVTPAFLKNYRKYAYVALLFIAAIITPSGDMLTQSIVCFPLIVLYEVSIFISTKVYKDQQRKDRDL